MATATLAGQMTEGAQEQPGPRLHILTFAERVVARIISCKRHKWGFPVTAQEMKKLYAWPYNAHQACNTCGRTRLYRFPAMEAGPLFEVTGKAGR